MTTIAKDFLENAKGYVAALAVIASLGVADMAYAGIGDNSGDSSEADDSVDGCGDCGEEPETPVTPVTPNTNNNSNTTDVDVNNNATANGGHATATGGSATATGGQGGEAEASSDANSNSTSSVGNTTSNSTSSANNGGQSQNLSVSNRESARAYAPTAAATGGNGVTCGKSIGISIGVGGMDTAFSGGLNLPAGVNETCMTNLRATAIISAGVATYSFNQVGGSDLLATGVAVMMQEDKKVDSAVKFIARQNCTSGNALDRFRPLCGESIVGIQKHTLEQRTLKQLILK